VTEPQKPEHAVPDGPEKGWSAADVDPSEFTDDDYAAQFPVVNEEPED
jgi:hypothetical protein